MDHVVVVNPVAPVLVDVFLELGQQGFEDEDVARFLADLLPGLPGGVEPVPAEPVDQVVESLLPDGPDVLGPQQPLEVGADPFQQPGQADKAEVDRGQLRIVRAGPVQLQPVLQPGAEPGAVAPLKQQLGLVDKQQDAFPAHLPRGPTNRVERLGGGQIVPIVRRQSRPGDGLEPVGESPPEARQVHPAGAVGQLGAKRGGRDHKPQMVRAFH